MNILESRVYRGPNIWRREPAIAMLVDRAGYGDGERSATETAAVKALSQLEAVSPAGDRGGDAEPGLTGDWQPGEVILRLVRALQVAVGAVVGLGAVGEGAGDGTFRLVYPYRDEAVGVAAGRIAMRLASTLMSGEVGQAALDDAVAEIRSVARSVQLGPSSSAIVDAARARGIPVSRPEERSSFIVLGWGTRQRRIWATATEGTGLVAAYTAADKELTGRLLADAGIPVPAGTVVDDRDDAVRIARRIGFPVVVKPLDGNHGRGVSLNVTGDDAVREAYERAAASAKGGRVLVQHQVEGRDYRILVVGGAVVAVAERISAHVIGDGVRTIRELVDAVNADPRRGEGHSSTLTRIPTGERTTSFLRAQGRAWEDIPAGEERVPVSGVANLSAGGTAIDRTDAIHPVNARLACEAALVTGLDVAGIDVVTRDIARPMTEDGGAIVEVNTAPGFRMHTNPSEGQARPVAEAVVNLLFPDGGTGRIPIVAVTGTNGKTTTTRMVAHLLRQDGRCVGLTSTDGMYIGDRLAEAGDMAGPKSARAILRHPLVEAAALETARGGIVREGLGFDRCDVGIVTNVTSDHLGLGGVHTLEDLARVKGVIPSAVAPTGATVLNADDPFVMGMVPHAGGEVILFSAHEESPTLREHIRRGGRGAALAQTRDGEMLRLLSAGSAIDLILATAIPATFGGLLHINAMNALAAAAGVWALGIPIETIRAGLATFEAGFATTPGRFNFLEVEGRHVLIDYAHNAAALEVVADVVRRFGAPRSVGMVAIPGDRSNDDTVGLGAQTARIFDTLVIREGNQRGRAPGESAGLIHQGARSVGMPEHEIHIVLDELDAAHAAVDIAKPGDLVVIFVTRAGRVWEELSARAVRATMAAMPETAREDASTDTLISS